MMGLMFNIAVAILGISIAASCGWSAFQIITAYKDTQGSEGAALLAQARKPQKNDSSTQAAAIAQEPSELAKKLSRAGIPFSPRQWIGLQVALCLVSAAAIFALGLSGTGSSGIGSAMLIALATIAGIVFLSRQILNSRIQSRLLLLEKQLAQIELQIAENSRSGLPFSRSILACSELTDEPLQGHLKRMYSELTYSNSTLAEGFENMAKRTGSSDARLLASVIAIQQQTGSNLADALTFLHETISRRVEMRQTLRSALAETKITRNIVAATPWAIFLLLAFAPYLKIQGFWEFYSQNPLGHAVLFGAVIAELAILLLISRLSNLKLE